MEVERRGCSFSSVSSAAIGFPLDLEVLSLVGSILLGLAQLAVGVALFRAVRGEATASTQTPEAPLASV